MKDLLDLILDFEKKLLVLLKDLYLHPDRIRESLVTKDNRYLTSFKFYSLVTSIWIILFQMGNSFFDFHPEENWLPDRLNAFLESERDFGVLIYPFVGLLEFFVPFGILNHLLFRKTNLTLSNNLSVATYLGGAILLYEIPVLAMVQFLDSMGLFSTELNVFTVIIIPVVYSGFAYIKIYTGRKLVVFLKAIAIVAGVGYFSISIIISSNIHEAIHRRFMFGRYIQFDIVPVSSKDISYRYIPLSENLSPALVVGTRALNSHLAVLWSDEEVFLRRVSRQDTMLLRLPMRVDNTFVVQENENAIYLTGHHWNVDSVFAYVVTNGSVGKRNMYNNYVRLHSRFKGGEDTVWFSGFDVKQRVPLIGRTNVSELQSAMQLFRGRETDHVVDDFIPYGDGKTFELLLSHSDERRRLRGILWKRISIRDTTLITEESQTLYQNDFSPTKNWYRKFLHNGKLIPVNDSTRITAFQVMNDSTMVLSVANLRATDGHMRWSKNFVVPADFAVFDHAFESNGSIYFLGRTLSIFRNDLNYAMIQQPYVRSISAASGEEEFFQFLQVDPGHGIDEINGGQIEEFYLAASSAYQDSTNLYWNLGAEHFYRIPKATRH